jgi:large subunit ribosomal protein L31e
MPEEKIKKQGEEIKEGETKEYIVPLRKKFLKTPKYKRAPKAIKALKKFVARNMKLRDRDLRKVKIDKYLNEEIWFRGIRKPPVKIKIKVKKIEDGNIRVELAELSERAKWKEKKEEKIKEEMKEKKEEKAKKAEEEEKEEKPEEEKEEKPEEEKKEEEEKEKATIEAGLKSAKKKAKEIRHEVKEKKIKRPLVRKALEK